MLAETGATGVTLTDRATGPQLTGGSVTKVVSPEAWTEVYNGCVRASVEASAIWKPRGLEVQTRMRQLEAAGHGSPSPAPQEQDVRGRGRLLPSFPLGQLKAGRSEKENSARVVEAATEQRDWR